MIKRLTAYMKPYRKYIILAILCITVETMFELVIPIIMADIIDVGVKCADKPYIFQRGILMAACAAAALVVRCRKRQICRRLWTGVRCGTAKGRVPEDPTFCVCQHRPFSNILSCHAIDRRCCHNTKRGFNRA